MTAKKRPQPSQAPAEPDVVTMSDGLSFESALEELEGVVAELERDDLTLDNALSRFERGIRLMRTCDAQLNHARGKITELLKGDDGAFIEKVLGTSLESFLGEEDDDG